MIEHLVLFKVRSSATPDQSAAMLRNLLALKDRIPGIVSVSGGTNFSARAKGYTHGFVVRFQDRAALDAYLPHPEHKSVVEKHVLPITEDILVVDFDPI